MPNFDQPCQGTFDWGPALDFLDGDSGLLRDVVEAFVGECPRLMSTIRDSIDQQDGASLHCAAHAMANAMKTLGCPVGAEASQKLVNLGRMDQFADAARPLAELHTEIDVLLPAAKALLQAAKPS